MSSRQFALSETLTFHTQHPPALVFSARSVESSHALPQSFQVLPCFQGWPTAYPQIFTNLSHLRPLTPPLPNQPQLHQKHLKQYSRNPPATRSERKSTCAYRALNPARNLLEVDDFVELVGHQRRPCNTGSQSRGHFTHRHKHTDDTPTCESEHKYRPRAPRQCQGKT